MNFVLPWPSSLYLNAAGSGNVPPRPSKFYFALEDVLPGPSKLSVNAEVDSIFPNLSSPRAVSPASSTDSGIDCTDKIFFEEPIDSDEAEKSLRVIGYLKRTPEQRARYIEKHKIDDNSKPTQPIAPPSRSSITPTLAQATTPEPKEKKNFTSVSVKNIIAHWEEKKIIKPESSSKNINFFGNSKIDKFRREKEEELKKEKEQELKKNKEKKLTREKEGRLKNTNAQFEEELHQEEKDLMKEKSKKLNKLLVHWEEKSKIKTDFSLKKVDFLENSNVNKLRKASEEKLKKEKGEKLKKRREEKLKQEKIKEFIKTFEEEMQEDKKNIIENRKRLKNIIEDELKKDKKILENLKQTLLTMKKIQKRLQMKKEKLLKQQKLNKLKKDEDDKIEKVKLIEVNQRKIDNQERSCGGTQTMTPLYCMESDNLRRRLVKSFKEGEKKDKFKTYRIRRPASHRPAKLTAAKFQMFNNKYNYCEEQVKYSQRRYYHDYESNDDLYHNNDHCDHIMRIDNSKDDFYHEDKDIRDRKPALFKPNYFKLTFI